MHTAELKKRIVNSRRLTTGVGMGGAESKKLTEESKTRIKEPRMRTK